MIRNPSAFIGEIVSGATDGAPLSVSATGKLASGISSTEVSATANTTTTSATDAVMNTMTITPVAGTYLVLFSSWLTHSNGNDTVTISVYVGGVQKTDSVRTTIPFVGALSAITQDIGVTTNGIVTVNGSQAIAIEWSTNGGTATAHQRTLDIIRLA